ncbi:MAG: hypothetical protein L3J98_14305 [Gammaproteobacteria bacterium]|nr:hypothetical protein [Gammaproteobacteria bacterium]MCF6261309.1 hypothetical protein [Gammaproteobacteria bacterium]
MSHDASATWSGFNYQGKVAIYHTLSLIYAKHDEDVNFDLSGYELILENHEDFDIKGPNGFKSFHQVKAINQTAFSTYENALFSMLLQLDAPVHETVNGYLHTWKPLNWNGDDSFEQKLRGIVNKVIQDNTDNTDTSYIQKTFTADSCVDKKVKILRQAKAEDVRLVDVASILNVITQIHSSNDPAAVVNRVKQYNYQGALACCIDHIDEKVKDKISSLHDIHEIDSDEDAVNKIFCSLLAKLDENIISKHFCINSDEETPILFSEILAVIVDGSLRDSDEAYLASRFKLQFIKAFEEFLGDEDLCLTEDAEAYSNKESNLNVAMDVLLNLPAIELWAYFKKFNPQVSLDSESAIDNALLTNLDNLRQFLFLIFQNMCCAKFIHSKQRSLVHYKSNNKSYLPTTIGNSTKRKLVKDIMRNGNAISSLYEVSAMVSGDDMVQEIECFSDEYSKLSEIKIEDFYVDEPLEDREKIFQVSREIRLIKISTAMEEINDA